MPACPSASPARDDRTRIPYSSLLQRLRRSGRYMTVREVSQEWLLIAASLYFVVCFNGAFWTAMRATRSEGAGDGAYFAAIGLVLTALHFIVMAVLSTRWTVKPVIGLMLLTGAICHYFTSSLGVYLDPDMLRNVLHTDYAEGRELLTPDLFMQLVFVAGLPMLVLARIRVRTVSPARALGVRLGAMLLMLILLAGGLALVSKDFLTQMRAHKEIRYLITPVSAIYSLVKVLGTDVRESNSVRMPIAADARQGQHWGSSNRPVIFVLVVGETARAANWGLNKATWSDYSGHDTTPQLSRRGVINFAHVSSCGTNTETSVPCMFSLQGRRHYDEDTIRQSESLLHVLNKAGLRVVWNDNQSGCKGVCDDLEIIRPERERLPALCAGERCLDEALLANSEALLRDPQGNLFLVLHQLGNHGPAYFKRYPATFRQFAPTCDSEDVSSCSREALTNSYDNALLYTDHLLAQTIDRLSALEDRYDTALLYVSDHGESLGERGLYLHGMPYAIAPSEQTRVPMVLWLSHAFKQRFELDGDCLAGKADQDLSHDNLFHTVLGMLDITTQARDASLDLTATCKRQG